MEVSTNKKTWKDYNQWLKYEKREEYFEEFDQVADEVRKNNEYLLEAFKDYLAAENLSEKTIKKYASYVDDYINLYLLYSRIITPVSNEGNLTDYLGYWASGKMIWTSLDGLRKSSTSLRKFYKFLVQVGEITEEQFKQVNESIKEGKELGENEFELESDGFYNSFF